MIVRIRALVSLLALAGAVFATGCVAPMEADGEADLAADPAPAAPTSAASTPPAPGGLHEPKEKAPDWHSLCFYDCMERGQTSDYCECVCGLVFCEV